MRHRLLGNIQASLSENGWCAWEEFNHGWNGYTTNTCICIDNHTVITHAHTDTHTDTRTRIVLHYITRNYIALILHYISLHCIAHSIALHYILVASCAAIVYRSRAHSAYQVPLLVLFSAVQTVPEILPHAGQCPCTACRTFVSHHHLSITIGSIGSIGSRRGDPTHRPSGSRRSPAFAPKR